MVQGAGQIPAELASTTQTWKIICCSFFWLTKATINQRPRSLTKFRCPPRPWNLTASVPCEGGSWEVSRAGTVWIPEWRRLDVRGHHHHHHQQHQPQIRGRAATFDFYKVRTRVGSKVAQITKYTHEVLRVNLKRSRWVVRQKRKSFQRNDRGRQRLHLRSFFER